MARGNLNSTRIRSRLPNSGRFISDSFTPQTGDIPAIYLLSKLLHAKQSGTLAMICVAVRSGSAIREHHNGRLLIA
jgi:hypothetical protein